MTGCHIKSIGSLLEAKEQVYLYTFDLQKALKGLLQKIQRCEIYYIINVTPLL